MKNLTLILFAFFLLSSCTTAKKCYRKFPPQTSTETIYRDSIREVIKYRDTTLYIKIPGETITNTVFVPVASPGQNYIPDTARAENKYAIGKAWLDWPKIKLTLIQKPQTLEFQLKNAIKEANVYRQLYEKEKSKEVVQVRYVPKFVKIIAWWGVIAFLALVAYLALKIRSKLI